MNTKKQPSTTKSLAVGTGAGTAIELAAAAFGVPLPAGTGTLLAGALAALAHWVQHKRAS